MLQLSAFTSEVVISTHMPLVLIILSWFPFSELLLIKSEVKQLFILGDGVSLSFNFPSHPHTVLGASCGPSQPGTVALWVSNGQISPSTSGKCKVLPLPATLLQIKSVPWAHIPVSTRWYVPSLPPLSSVVNFNTWWLFSCFATCCLYSTLWLLLDKVQFPA